MPNKLPSVSSKKILSLFKKNGYEIVRQKGSHIRLEKVTPVGTHKITIPNHDPIAKGTLNDILNKLSVWNQIPKKNLIEEL